MRVRAHAVVASLTRVLFHRVVQQIVHRALELSSHLFEARPKRFATLEGASGLSVVGHGENLETRAPVAERARSEQLCDAPRQQSAITAYQVSVRPSTIKAVGLYSYGLLLRSVELGDELLRPILAHSGDDAIFHDMPPARSPARGPNLSLCLATPLALPPGPARLCLPAPAGRAAAGASVGR